MQVVTSGTSHLNFYEAVDFAVFENDEARRAPLPGKYYLSRTALPGILSVFFLYYAVRAFPAAYYALYRRNTGRVHQNLGIFRHP